LNVEAIGAFSNHLALSIKNADVYEMARDCNSIDLTMHPIQVHTARAISTTQQWVCYLASFFHSDAMFEKLLPPPTPPFWRIKQRDPLIPSRSYTAKWILKHLILYVINRESCRHLCLPTVHTL